MKLRWKMPITAIRAHIELIMSFHIGVVVNQPNTRNNTAASNAMPVTAGGKEKRFLAICTAAEPAAE